MKFKGDIIITDPCYICKEKDYSAPKIGERSEEEDYFIYGWDAKKYPDAVAVYLYGDDIPDYIRDIREQFRDIDDDDENDEPYIEYHSKIYDECMEKYLEALRKYNELNGSDWHRCDCGKNMEILGIHTYICRNTLYGDWSCTTYNSDTKEELGAFCADAGMVGVFLLDEVMKYNPDFDYHINRPWTTTLIKNFDGEVDFEIVESSGVYEEDTEWYKKGEEWTDTEVSVVGKGNINFETHQTGL